MTPKQKEKYNSMLSTLKKIAKGYQTPDQLRKNATEEYGIEYEEALEMSYENIQQEAKDCARRVRKL